MIGALRRRFGPSRLTPWARLRLGVWVLLLLAGIGGALQGTALGQGKAPVQGEVFKVDIDGMINPGALGLLEYGIETAEAADARALIVRIDTPGGLISTTRDMVSAIADSRVPVIAYVGPTGASATSAGAFILLSAHVAVMNTGTNAGASSPVTGEGGDIEGTMGKKVMNDTRAFMRSIANSRGRNADLAERFVTEADSVTAAEALEGDVIDLVVPEFQDLLAAVDGREILFHGQPVTLDLANADIREVEPRLIDRVLEIVAQPQIAHLLISLGMLAIYIEILSPGLAFPGIFGAIALILGFVGLQTLPVNVGFLILLLLGIVLMFAEYFVAGFGVLGIGGAVAFVLGSLNLFEGTVAPEDQDAILSVSIAVSAAVLVTTFLITRSFFRGSRRAEPMEGKVGEAMAGFESSGHVLIDDQRWAADTLEPLRHGDKIVVVKRAGYDRLTVKKADNGKAQ